VREGWSAGESACVTCHTSMKAIPLWCAQHNYNFGPMAGTQKWTDDTEMLGGNRWGNLMRMKGE
jgi:hypothetical protein